VNAHTHLELSHLEGAVPGGRGFVTWIEDQLRVRAERSPDEVRPAVRRAIADMQAAGTTAVADVSNSLATVAPLRESGLHALVLHEILGFDPTKASRVLAQTKAARAALSPSPDPSVRIAVAAHAPHSISRELFALLMSDGGVKSIHLAESRSEDEFLRDGSGEWREFLNRRVGPVAFDAPNATPVQYLEALGVLKPGLLAVHCVRVDETDAKLLAARGAVAVLCPRSNEFLGNGVPPLALLLGNGVSLALGTDSLASCPSLDVLEDARLLARKFPRVPKPAILHALTRGGALALGFGGLGEIRAGTLARFAAIAFEGVPPADPLAFVLNETAPARGVA
jgi:cytosine/adenosine deaminase-related metal-dependent hydrolase